MLTLAFSAGPTRFRMSGCVFHGGLSQLGVYLQTALVQPPDASATGARSGSAYFFLAIPGTIEFRLPIFYFGVSM